MLRFVVRTALAKKVRLLSTSLAVLLGVAFLTGTLVFTDTIGRTFDDLFADIYDETDAVVRSSDQLETATGETRRARIPESVVDVVAAVDGVAEAHATVASFAQVVGADGDAIGDPGRGAPTFGMSYLPGSLAPWQLTEGSRAPGPGELVLDRGTAERGDLAIGDTVTVLTQTGPHQLPLVGTARFGSVDSPGGASVSLFDLATAQDLLVAAPEEIDDVWVDAVPGVDEDELTTRIAAVLPGGLEAVTGSQVTEETQDVMHDALGFFSTVLLVFAAIGLTVACFTIYNTFQIIVTQRAREMATLRALGATRRQVLATQLLEAALIGLVASVVGLVVGVGVAGAMQSLLALGGMDIPSTGAELEAGTAVAAVTVGVLATVVSAVLPSLRASRVRPLAALRDVGAGSTPSQPARLAAASGVILLGACAVGAGLAGLGIAWVGIGALVLFLGVFSLGPAIARPVVRLLGVPVSATGVVAELAVENAARNPKRTARTGGALMIGVALVSAVTMIAATAKDWTRDLFGGTFHGDYVVSTDAFGAGGLSPDLAHDLQTLPEVAAAVGVRIGSATIVGGAEERPITYAAVDPGTVGEVFDVGVTDGTLARLGDDGIFVDDGEADQLGVRVGDTVELGFLGGQRRTLMVAGIFTEEELAGGFLVSHGLHEQSGVDQFDFSVYVAAAPGTTAAEVVAAIEAASAPYANAEVLSRKDYIETQAAQVDQLVNIVYGLLGLAVVIALLSIANSMVLSVHERVRELGLLRAVGMTRAQTRASMRWEAVLIALLGAGLGLLLGVFLGWSISVTLRGDGLGTFSFPAGSLVVIVGGAVLGGVLAAIRPARKAARLDVLEAIAT